MLQQLKELSHVEKCWHKMDRIDKTQIRPFQFLYERESAASSYKQKILQLAMTILSANHIDIDIRKTDAIALVGPNGVGKTTLLKTIVAD